MNDEQLTWLEPQSPEEIMEDLITNYNKDRFYCLFSGGKDSVCVADFIATNYPDRFAGVVFTNTGIGTQKTRQWVLEYCKEREWPLEMTWAHRSYYSFVMKFGFPGPQVHRMVMGFLKYQTWYYFMKWKIGLGEKACFISGVRKKESQARDKIKIYTRKPIDTDTHLVFCKPFLYKNGEQLWKYFAENDLKKSPAYTWFDKSGECWCGAFAHPWELKMLEKHDPLTFNTIKNLEKQIQIHGSEHAKQFPKWGHSTGADQAELQTTLEQFNVNEDYCGESCII